MQFQQLSAFKAVYELGTVTAAADYIHITQPAVSRLIASLETKVGFKLFQRVKGRLLPTEKGQAFYQEVAKAYGAIENLSTSAEEIKQSHHGSLHIAAFPMLSSFLLPKLLAQFIVKHPNLVTSLKTFRSEEIQRKTALQACDVGFALLPEVTEGVESIELQSECVCILHKDSPLAQHPQITPTLLQGTPLISCEKDDTQLQVDRAFKKHRVKRNEVAEVSLATAVASLVANGVGAAIIDPFSAQLAVEHHDSIIIKPFSPKVTFSFFIMLPSLKRRSNLVENFVNEFIEHALKLGAVRL